MQTQEPYDDPFYQGTRWGGKRGNDGALWVRGMLPRRHQHNEREHLLHGESAGPGGYPLGYPRSVLGQRGDCWCFKCDFPKPAHATKRMCPCRGEEISEVGTFLQKIDVGRQAQLWREDQRRQAEDERWYGEQEAFNREWREKRSRGDRSPSPRLEDDEEAVAIK